MERSQQDAQNSAQAAPCYKPYISTCLGLLCFLGDHGQIISKRPSIALQRAAAAGTLHQETYKRLNMALFTFAALSAGISIMRRSLWSAQGLM